MNRNLQNPVGGFAIVPSVHVKIDCILIFFEQKTAPRTYSTQAAFRDEQRCYRPRDESLKYPQAV
jgi:hypothetical protein